MIHFLISACKDDKSYFAKQHHLQPGIKSIVNNFFNIEINLVFD